MIFLLLLISLTNSHADDTFGLIIGGQCTHAGNLCNYIEKISPDSVCVVDIPPPPIHSQEAEAVYFQGSLWICGGCNNTQLLATDYCISYPLGEKDAEWVVENSLVMERARFGMTVIGDQMYIVGGYGDGVSGNNPEAEHTVEVYTSGEGWKLAENMRLDQSSTGGCSVVINDEILVLIGGIRDGEYLSSVMSYNVKEDSGTWVALSDLQEPRYQPACITGYFDDQFGIFVTSGEHYSAESGGSVEFYVIEANTWIYLEPLNDQRGSHNVFEVNGSLMVAGGGRKSTEILENTQWIQTLDLKEPRWSSAGVTIPSGLLGCISEN